MPVGTNKLKILVVARFRGNLFHTLTWSVDEFALSEASYLYPFQEEDCWCDVALQDLRGNLGRKLVVFRI